MQDEEPSQAAVGIAHFNGLALLQSAALLMSARLHPPLAHRFCHGAAAATRRGGPRTNNNRRGAPHTQVHGTKNKKTKRAVNTAVAINMAADMAMTHKQCQKQGHDQSIGSASMALSLGASTTPLPIFNPGTLSTRTLFR